MKVLFFLSNYQWAIISFCFSRLLTEHKYANERILNDLVMRSSCVIKKISWSAERLVSRTRGRHSGRTAWPANFQPDLARFLRLPVTFILYQSKLGYTLLTRRVKSGKYFSKKFIILKRFSCVNYLLDFTFDSKWRNTLNKIHII